MAQAVSNVGPEILHKMRKILRLPQQEVAKRTGIDQGKISRFENGLVELTAEELRSYSTLINEVMLKQSEDRSLSRLENVPQTSVKRGRELRKLREQWGITQAELSEGCDMPACIVSAFERGYTELDDDELERLSKALNSLVDRNRAQLKRFEKSVKETRPATKTLSYPDYKKWYEKNKL